jgi:hypothetical protein
MMNTQATRRTRGKHVRLQDAGIPKTDIKTRKKMNRNVAKTFLFNDLGSIVRGNCRAIATVQRGK